MTSWFAPLWPTGMTITPPTASCAFNASGTSGAAAVTIIRSKGRLFRPPPMTVAEPGDDVVEAKLPEPLLCLAQQRAVALDGIDPPAEFRKDRGLVSRPRPDLEHTHPRAELQGARHERNDIRLADGLSLLDRKRRILVGLVAEVGEHEFLAGNALQCRQHAGVGDPRLTQFHDQPDFSRVVRHFSACSRACLVRRWVRSICRGGHRDAATRDDRQIRSGMDLPLVSTEPDPIIRHVSGVDALVDEDIGRITLSLSRHREFLHARRHDVGEIHIDEHARRPTPPSATGAAVWAHGARPCAI